ncbi:hypothetical protein [Modestobacter roseus]|nr:hypothetical protein [Modestobacter roseus]MQA33901.1 hypothetical protein [Modestobacter roseus]
MSLDFVIAAVRTTETDNARYWWSAGAHPGGNEQSNEQYGRVNEPRCGHCDRSIRGPALCCGHVLAIKEVVATAPAPT